MNRPDDPGSPPPLRLLFVCTGNTCRSPMAEVLAKGLARDLGMEEVDVRSAGTHAATGGPASQGARSAARRAGYSLEGHTATPLTEALVEWADWVLVMGPSHVQAVKRLGGKGKVALLGDFASLPEDGGEDTSQDRSVPDPFGGGEELYQATFETLASYLESAMKRLAKMRGER